MKDQIYWAVLTPDDQPLLYSVDLSEEECIQTFMLMFTGSWEYYHEMGYRAQEFRITKKRRVMRTKEQILNKLKECHQQEDELNKALSEIDKKIDQFQKSKIKTAKLISKNMKYRNLLISQL